MDTVTKNSYNFSLVFVKDYTCPEKKATFKAGEQYDYTSTRLHKQYQKGTGIVTKTEWFQTYPFYKDVVPPRDTYKLIRRDYVQVTTTTVTVTEE